MLKAGSCAAGHREPGQVRKEAALSGCSRVPQGCLAGADGRGRAGHLDSTAGCTIVFESHLVSGSLLIAQLAMCGTLSPVQIRLHMTPNEE